MSASVCACVLLSVCVCVCVACFIYWAAALCGCNGNIHPEVICIRQKSLKFHTINLTNCQPPPPVATTALHQAEIVATWVSSNVFSSSSSSYSLTISYCCFCCVCLVYGFLFLSIFEQSKLRATIKKIKKNNKKIPWHVMCSSYVCG